MKCSEDVHTEAAFTLQEQNGFTAQKQLLFSIPDISLNSHTSNLNNVEKINNTKDLTPDALRSVSSSVATF